MNTKTLDQLFDVSHSFSNEIKDITTDSRKVSLGSLFIAISGEKLDGHEFIEKAVLQGACAILHSKPIATKHPNVCYYQAQDTVLGFRKIAAHIRSQIQHKPVIAVTGSVGKTSTKEMLGAILCGKYNKILKTQGSQNGFLGIPITFADYQKECEALVIEVGIDEIGAMQSHMELVRPTHTLLTAIGPEHLEKLIDMDTVAREENLSLSWTAINGGTTIINLDDAFIQRDFPNSYGFTLTNKQYPNKPYLKGTLQGDELFVEAVNVPKDLYNYKFSCKLLLPGIHNAQNLLCAITCAWSLHLNEKEILAGLTQFAGGEGRSEVKLYKSHKVLCDYYNANPTSVVAAIQTLLTLKPHAGAHSWVVLGDMLELGLDEQKLHRELATTIVAAKISHVLLYGERMRWLDDELKKLGISTQHCATKLQIAEVLRSKVSRDDVILIKGSRGMRMEEVWKALSQS